jgi:hypothetical protein
MENTGGGPGGISEANGGFADEYSPAVEEYSSTNTYRGNPQPKTNARKTTAPGEVPPRRRPFLFGTLGSVGIVTVIIHILLVL